MKVTRRSLLMFAPWTIAFLCLAIAGSEFLLRFRDARRERLDAEAAPLRSRLERAYGPFGEQHLHPQYLTYFSPVPAERVALSNEVCTLDEAGFRGGGPGTAKEGLGTPPRRLAFLLGGSTAFGYMASSDATTITGYLNRSQDRYFFVNAGVPSWTSTQEMFRMAFELVDYKPDLVVTLDGANDAMLLAINSRGPVRYQPGAPDSFGDFARLADERSGDVQWRRLLPSLFPALSRRLSRESETVPPLADAVLQAGAARYLANLGRIRDLASAAGARFVAAFQPVAGLHAQVSASLRQDEVDVLGGFHRHAMAQAHGSLELHDFSRLFDGSGASVRVDTEEISPEAIFLDQVHLTDRGNERVANELLALIKMP